MPAGASAVRAAGSPARWLVRALVAAALVLAAVVLVPAALAEPDVPDAQTQPATGVESAAATLNGLLVPDRRTVWHFEYGTTTDYGLSTPAQPSPAPPDDDTAPEAPVPVSALVTGLAPATMYHFRLVAATGRHGRPAVGADATFTTLAAPIVALGPPPPAPIKPSAGPEPVAPASAAPPVLGESVGVEVRSGAVEVRDPGSAQYVPVTADSTIPVGAIVDTTDGGITLRSALPNGRIQTGIFHGGKFEVRQPANAGGLVELVLRGAPASCGRGTSGRAAAAQRRRPPRALWGRDSGGRYRTRGGSSVTTTRGTAWFVEDRCGGTLTRVSQGSVSVRDLRRKRTVVVRAGHSYLARSRG